MCYKNVSSSRKYHRPNTNHKTHFVNKQKIHEKVLDKNYIYVVKFYMVSCLIPLKSNESN